MSGASDSPGAAWGATSISPFPMPCTCSVLSGEAVKDVARVERAFVSELTFPPSRERGLPATQAPPLHGLNGAVFLSNGQGQLETECV